MVTGRHCRRQLCRPRQSPAGCARRRPIAAPEDAGSIPATSKNGLVVKLQTRTLLEVRRRLTRYGSDIHELGICEPRRAGDSPGNTEVNRPVALVKPAPMSELSRPGALPRPPGRWRSCSLSSPCSQLAVRSRLCGSCRSSQRLRECRRRGQLHGEDQTSPGMMAAIRTQLPVRTRQPHAFVCVTGVTPPPVGR